MKETIHKTEFKTISDAVTDSYQNSILEVVNDHCLRMSVMEEAYKWHYHEHSDELFIVLEGELKIEIKDRDTLFVRPGEYVKIPAKTIHKTTAIGRTVNLCFEKNASDTVYLE